MKCLLCETLLGRYGTLKAQCTCSAWNPRDSFHSQLQDPTIPPSWHKRSGLIKWWKLWPDCCRAACCPASNWRASTTWRRWRAVTSACAATSWATLPAWPWDSPPTLLMAWTEGIAYNPALATLNTLAEATCKSFVLAWPKKLQFRGNARRMKNFINLLVSPAPEKIDYVAAVTGMVNIRDEC